MQLTVREVSELLNVSESTVTRWIKQRGLPSQHVGGQFRFNRAELLEWATTHRIKVSVELFERPEAEAEAVPSLAEALQAGGIHYHVGERTRDRVLHALVQALPLPEGINRDEIYHLFLVRESLASTAIGGGIALPHVRNPMVLHVERPLVTLCFLDEPVDFGALDGQPVRVLFSLICPTMKSHLQTLSRLSHALRDDRFKEVVMRQGSTEEILREVRRIETTLSAPALGAGKVNP
jgi:PTS system nitrogen regulatory IIA component